jgi:hypothetical protein
MWKNIWISYSGNSLLFQKTFLSHSLAFNHYYGPLKLYLDLWSNSELTEIWDHPKIYTGTMNNSWTSSSVAKSKMTINQNIIFFSEFQIDHEFPCFKNKEAILMNFKGSIAFYLSMWTKIKRGYEHAQFLNSASIQDVLYCDLGSCEHVPT